MKIYFTERAVEDLKLMRHHTTKILLSWIRRHLEESSDPRLKGQQLCCDRPGQWCYRVGVYRILADLHGDSVVILTIVEGHHMALHHG